MQSQHLDPLDAQDLVLAIPARWVFDMPPKELGELADAVLVSTDGPELEAILSRAVDRCWGPVVEEELRDSLNELGAEWPTYRDQVRSALLELDARHGASDLARAFMLQSATQYAYDGFPFTLCLCCIEEGLAVADEADRRALALKAAVVAIRDAAIDEQEVAVAVRACALTPGELPELLATDARREAVRLRLGRIAALGAGSLPGLSRELSAAVRQSAVSAAADDQLWAAACREVGRASAAPERN